MPSPRARRGADVWMVGTWGRHGGSVGAASPVSRLAGTGFAAAKKVQDSAGTPRVLATADKECRGTPPAVPGVEEIDDLVDSVASHV